MVNEKGVSVLTSVLIVVAVVVIGGLIIANWSKLTGHASAGEVCTQDSDCDSGVCMDGVCLDAASAEAALAGKVTSTGTRPTKATVSKATKPTKASYSCSETDGGDFNATAGTTNLTSLPSGKIRSEKDTCLSLEILNESYCASSTAGSISHHIYNCTLENKVCVSNLNGEGSCVSPPPCDPFEPVIEEYIDCDYPC